MAEKKIAYYLSLPYRVEIRFDNEDGVWFARFPELPGCEADGSTREESLARAEEVKELWIRGALKRGRQIPEPQPESNYSGKILLRLPKILHQQAAEAADLEGVSLNTYLIQAVTEAVQHSGIKSILRFLGGYLERYFANHPQITAHLISVLAEPYGQEDQAITTEKNAQLPGQELEDVGS